MKHLVTAPAADDCTPMCPACGHPFAPKRSDQRFCTKSCAKTATRNAARGPRTVADSPEEKRRNETRKGRVRGLSDALYETPPAYRAEFLERLTAEARGNAELRRLVTVRALLRSWDRAEGTGRLHIAHVLDHYCQEVYGQRSFDVLDPATVLPTAEELAFPAEYYGPDAPPLYEDGSLKLRPCTWEAGKKERGLIANPPPTTIRGTSTGTYDWRLVARAMKDRGWERYFTAEELQGMPGHLQLPRAKSPSTTIKEDLEGEPLRFPPSGLGYVKREPSEFFAQLKALRDAHPLSTLPDPDTLAKRRMAYAEEIGMDSNINAPL